MAHIKAIVKRDLRMHIVRHFGFSETNRQYQPTTPAERIQSAFVAGKSGYWFSLIQARRLYSGRER